MKFVRWISAHLDSTGDLAGVRSAFWSMVTGYSTSSDGTLLPPDGDPYLSCSPLRMGQPVVLEVFSKHVDQLARAATTGGGRLVVSDGGSVVVTSPAGVLWKISPWDGRKTTPTPVSRSPELLEGMTITGRVDQVMLTVAPELFEAEAEYWSSVLGWSVIDSALPNFLMFVDKAMPLRLVLLRHASADPTEPAGVHLEVACGGAADLERTMVWHGTLGAHRGERHAWWYGMTDPVGEMYALTRRDPRTGAIIAK